MIAKAYPKDGNLEKPSPTVNFVYAERESELRIIWGNFTNFDNFVVEKELAIPMSYNILVIGVQLGAFRQSGRKNINNKT